ncbi:MAG: sulfur carrier protein ThiS [Desulfovibrio sp.]|jgi:thiamine biosynthesis protein ThiS|nr:sulfur carrier protein ThiS [Desulfovibrio sp.]
MDTRELVVNGEKRASAARTLSELLDELALAEQAVVAELNGNVIDRKDYAATCLAGGDVVELIRFVGGG